MKSASYRVMHRWTMLLVHSIDMNELTQLQSSLSHVFHEALSTSLGWEDLKSVKRLQEINGKLDGLSSAPTNASINQVVAAYRSSQRVTTFRELKYLCYGLATRIQDDWVLLGDDKLRGDLLADIERLGESRQRLRCFQALLSSYFSFSRYDEQTTKEAFAGWEILRDWLARQRTQFALDGRNGKIRLPNWFVALTKHENLLTNNPCHRYGEDMLHGNNSKIEEARQCLGILADSWVMEETILSQVRAAAEFGDDPFKSHLENLLKLVQGQTEVKVSPLLKLRAVAILISRYACCASKLEQPVLRDVAVSSIGNPWLRKMEWDAWVKTPDGQPDTAAREMVNGWLKRRLITDFFDLLSTDGKAVQRRLKYWLRFESAIEDLWFVLGSDACHKAKYDPRYKEVQNRTDKKNWLRLVGESDSANNAFVMRIGNKLIVAFGLTNNACFMYSASHAPFSLDSGQISESRLKIYNSNNIGNKYSHSGSWEDKFDSAIRSNIEHHSTIAKTANIPPLTVQVAAHKFTYVEQYVKKFAITTDNKIDVGGAFWVLIQKGKHPKIDQDLESWGFKYKPERGWWKQ